MSRFAVHAAAVTTWSADDAPVLEVPAVRPERDLGAIVREAGWPCAEDARSPFHVELETPQPAIARVERREPEGVVVSVDLELEQERAPTAACERAVELHLLRVGAAVRLVRAVIDGSEGGVARRLAVSFAADPAADDMDQALTALSLAWRGAAREARVLHRDDAIARRYLALFDPDRGETERAFGPKDRPAGAVPAAVTQGKGNPE